MVYPERKRPIKIRYHYSNDKNEDGDYGIREVLNTKQIE